LPIFAAAKRFLFERYIKTLSQRIMITYRLLIAIEHSLPNWVLVDYRKYSTPKLGVPGKPKHDPFGGAKPRF
jgi:hypothetical protein